jgi:hypothetical protein
MEISEAENCQPILISPGEEGEGKVWVVFGM